MSTAWETCAKGLADHTTASRRKALAACAPAAPCAHVGPVYGRDEDLVAAGYLLDEARLLTLVGEPGVGKTRLAVELLGKRLEPKLRVDVGTAAEAGLARAVADLAGVVPAPDTPILHALVTAFRERDETLLLLDNCEHDLAACGELLATVLSQCPRLKALATSRELLLLPGETVYTVTGLPTRAPDGCTPGAAMRLFVDRARAGRDDPFTAGQLEDVAGICQALDGNPLAIELAAELGRVRTPAAVLAALKDRFTVLSTGRCVTDGRHSSLYTAIDWSYRRLSAAEQAAFRQLAVFAGTFEPATAQAVIHVPAAGDTPAPTLPLLRSLEARSLLAVRRGLGAGARLAMTGSVRAFALDRLAESAERPGAEARLAGAMLRLVRPHTMAGLLPGCASEGLLEEIDNVTAAVDLLAQTADERQVDLAVALLVARDAVADRVGILRLARTLSHIAPGTAGYGTALSTMAVLAARGGNCGLALRLADRAVTLERCAPRALPHRLRARASVRARAGDLDGAVRDAADGAELAARMGDKETEFWCRTDLLGHLVGQERLVRAAETARTLALADPGVPPSPILAALGHALGALELRLGDLTAATGHFVSGLIESCTDTSLTAYNLEGMALVAAATSAPERSLRLSGAAHALREHTGDPAPPWWQQYVGEARTVAFRALPNSRARAAARAGAALTARQAVAYALDEEDGAPAGRPAAPTDREREVISLLTEGLTNQQIAIRLHISVRTVETHIRHVRHLHGLRSRAHLAAWSVRQPGLTRVEAAQDPPRPPERAADDPGTRHQRMHLRYGQEDSRA
ncbi:ATP-binding protein [Streptomyces fuscichromogenes]|uniref:HTH luxR-type domain-containing protein n=1 Tax=Streptomyces fuscichromogenes TaxID=1324013 RepID=A0A917XP53_9ACTN|nr:LuxR C-terminal-related transcriptional regulator [Streptomyces fuscichromogenes]GGN45526.1 hypothetical protein GCM10011578_097550 [Streptomyces fuscichromogenes]